MDTALALPLTAAPPSTTAPVSVQPPANGGAQSAGLVAGLGAGLGAGPGADAAGQATPFRTIVEELLAQAGGTGSANIPSGSPTIAGGTRATQSASPLTASGKDAKPGSKAATPNQPEANAQWLALLFAMPVATPELPQTVAQPQASTPAKDGDLQLATLRAPESGSESKVDARPSANAGSNLPATASGDLLSFALPIAISPAPIVNAVAPQETQAPSDPSKHLAAAPNSSDLPLAGIPVSISSPPQRPTVGVPFADLLQQLSAVSQSGIETKQIAVSSESANAGAPDQPATSTQVRAPQPPPANVLTVPVEPSPTTASLPHPHASAPARSTPQAEPLAPASPPQQGTNDSLSYEGDPGPSAGSADSPVSAKAVSPFSQAMTATETSGPAPSAAQKDSAQAPVIPHPLPSTVPSTAPSSNTVTSSTSSSPTPPSTSLGALSQDPTGTKSVSDAQLSQAAGHTEMRIAMQSDKLGTIELHARVTGDEVGAAITVEKRDAHAALAVELPALQQALSDKQLKVEHVTLLQSSGHAMAGGTGGDTQQQEGRARAFSQAGTTAVPHSAAYAADFVTIAAEPEAALNVFGRLSVRA